MNELEIYTNKKFDIMKIIKMVLKRKGWGEKYTLYSTPTHEIYAIMQYYNFEDKYASFKIAINEKQGNGFYYNSLNIYTDRKDYTIKFVNNLLLKSIISYLKKYRENIFEEEARKMFPYVNKWEKGNDEWIEILELQEKVDKIKSLELDDDEKENILEDYIDRALSEYEDKITYKPRKKYVENALESNREKPILDLIEEIKKELEENNE